MKTSFTHSEDCMCHHCLFPRDNKGRAVPRACPECDCGILQYEGEGFWRCDGLADPGRNEKALVACTFTHQDGTAL